MAAQFATWINAPRSSAIDVVVVGSGYGGSVPAARLADAGRNVVGLERGSEYLPGDFPNDFGQLAAFQRAVGRDGLMGRASGLFDWHVGSSAAALVANGVGGGSLINAGVMLRPTPD